MTDPTNSAHQPGPPSTAEIDRPLVSGWTLALGIVMLLLGVAGFGATFGLTLTTVLVFGWFLIVGGALQFVGSFAPEAWGNRLVSIVIALLYVAAGVLLVTRPLAGSVIITAIIGVALLVVGLSRFVVGLSIREQTPAWLLVLLSGVASIIVGALILARWPGNSVWVIGLFVAIELFIQGWMLIALWAAARSVRGGLSPSEGGAAG